MCNNQNVPSVTLQTAVLMQVKDFAQNNQQFSVHDITRAIRQKTGSGELEIPEVEVTGASFRFDIPHTKVKALFEELWRTGVFDPDFTLDRQFTGMYYQYTPVSLQQPASPAPATAISLPTVSATAASTPPAKIIVPSTNLHWGAVTDRVEIYLSHCANRGVQPTLKQVQSAIKRGNVSTGWSCDDLLDIIENDLCYQVNPDPDFGSASQVVV